MSVRRGIGYLFGGNVGTFVLQFAGSLAIARLLNPSELGVYAAAMALVWIINGVLNVGIQAYVVRERDMPPDKLGTVFLMTLCQSVLISAGLLLGAPLVGMFAHDPRVTASLRILAWFGALMPILATLTGVMQREMKFDRVVLCTLANVASAAVFTITLAANGFSWRSMPLGAGAGVTIAVAIAIVMQRADLRVARLGFSHARAILSFGVGILPASLIQSITNRAPDVLLTRALGAGATGIYNRGANLIDTLNNTVMLSVQRVMSSQMARDRETPAGIGPIYARMNRAVTGVFWPAFALLAVLAGPMIAFLFGPKWLGAAPILAIIAVSAAINLMVACRSGVLVTMGRERQLPRLELARGLVGVAAFTIAAYTGGLLWAAATRVLDAVVAVALYSPGIHDATRLTWAEMARGFVRSALIAAITAVPAAVLMTMHGWPGQLPTIELLGLLAVSGFVWLAAVFALRHDLAPEITRAVGYARGLLPRLA